MRKLIPSFILSLLMVASLFGCIPSITSAAVLPATPIEGYVSISEVAGITTLRLDAKNPTDVAQWEVIAFPDTLVDNTPTTLEDGLYSVTAKDTERIFIEGRYAVFSVQFSFTDSTTEFFIDFPECLALLTCGALEEPPNP